jgi:hypothetical protein
MLELPIIFKLLVYFPSFKEKPGVLHRTFKTYFKSRSLHPEDGGRMVLQNVGNLPQHYMASQPTRP